MRFFCRGSDPDPVNANPDPEPWYYYDTPQLCVSHPSSGKPKKRSNFFSGPATKRGFEGGGGLVIKKKNFFEDAIKHKNMWPLRSRGRGIKDTKKAI